MLLLDYILEGAESFDDNPEKWENWLDSIGFPKEGFFRDCVDKASFADDPEEFCGAIKSWAVDRGLANPG